MSTNTGLTMQDLQKLKLGMADRLMNHHERMNFRWTFRWPGLGRSRKTGARSKHRST